MKNSDNGSMISARLEDRYLTGIQILMEKRQKEGFRKPNRTELLKEGLELLFRKYGVRVRDIKERLESVQAEGEPE